MPRFGRALESLRRRVPSWLLIALILVAAVSSVGIFVAYNLLSSHGPSGPKPDFTMRASQSSKTNLTANAIVFSLTVTSENAFTGVVSLTANAPPGVTVTIATPTLNAPTLLLGSSANATVTVIPKYSQNYTITVTGTSGTLSHSVELSTLAQGVLFSASPTVIDVTGNLTTSILTLTSQNGFSGHLDLSAKATICDSCSITVTPSRVYVPQGGSTTATLNATAGYWWFGSQVDVVAIGVDEAFPVSIIWSGLGVVFGENLTLRTDLFTSDTNVTLNLMNDGRFPLYPYAYNVEYTVSDGSGDVYSCAASCVTFPLAKFSPFSTTPFATPIGTSCPKCTLTGSAFVFVTGQSYTITLYTYTGIFYDPYGPTLSVTVKR